MRGTRIGLFLAMAAAAAAGCAHPGADSGARAPEVGVTRAPFGDGPGGEKVEVFTIVNSAGVRARITNYGGIVVSLEVPDRKGRRGDVVLGYDSLAEYVKNNPYFGCIVGRYGNRIGGARFSLGGKECALAANNGPNNLHGGVKGFDKVVWAATPRETPEGPALVLRYVSADGEEGFPGRLDCTVTYLLTHANELKIDYLAMSDEETIVNLTNHSYFNLKGAGAGDILDHVVTIHGARFTPVDKDLIPTGEIRSVKGTPFDFTSPREIGARIDADDEQIGFGKGYDHNWVLDSQDGSLKPAARVTEETSGRVLEVLTTEPGVQFYTGNFLDGTNVGKGGIAYPHRGGFCLETQHYPDSPNKLEFPPVVLKPGEKYRTRTVYRFSAK